jgi:hypothetical protein
VATSVKLLVRDKERLDRLQGEIMARRGRKVTQQTLLSWLLDLGEAEKDRLAEGASGPMSDREVAQLMRLVVRTGIPTQEEDIDDTISREIR